MKVVLFCGGLGARLREYSETIPKPMVTIGYRPILWHVMKYYAHWGHTDFVLCLGYRGDAIKDYFLNYDECLSNDFTLSRGGREVHLFRRDIDDWRITFVDTGLHATVGQRLRAVEEHLDGEEVFLANYADGVSDLPLPAYLDFFRRQRRVATFVAVRPSQTFHVVALDGDGQVEDIRHVVDADLWINGGFFVFRREIFDYLGEGEDLVEAPFHRLVAKQQLAAYRYPGFWQCMDTFKDKQLLDQMAAAGPAPWEIWKHGPPAPALRRAC
jgi:glucose-1-phosphate cytidylyltransferase